MNDSFALNPFVRIARDNTVIVVVNKSEMGQGVYTSLPMLVAEELECELSSIRVEPAPVEPAYRHTLFGIQSTGGSTSILSEWDRMRRVGAGAREMLVTAAADTWKVSRASCRAEKGAVVHESGKRLTYGELAEKASAVPAPGEVPLKGPEAFKIIGRPTRRLDGADKVKGKAIFGMDVAIPGMLVAVIARPPVFGAKVKGFNAEKARAVAGVKRW